MNVLFTGRCRVIINGLVGKLARVVVTLSVLISLLITSTWPPSIGFEGVCRSLSV